MKHKWQDEIIDELKKELESEKRHRSEATDLLRRMWDWQATIQEFVPDDLSVAVCKFLGTEG